LASSIEPAPSLKDFRFQRRRDISEAIESGPRLYEDIFGDAHASQAAMCPLDSSYGHLAALAHDHKQVEIAS